MAKTSNWEVYIIQAKNGKLYTGITNDFNRRFTEHLESQKGARFFHFSSPESVVFRESHSNRSEASKREAMVKKMSRQQKLDLIQSECNSVSDLG